MKNSIRVAICVMLVVSVLTMSLSVFADDDVEPDNPLLNYDFDQVAFLVWQLLESWGIDITYDDIHEYTGAVQDVISDWILEYLEEQPSVESVVAWIADWVFDTDFWGNLVVNNSLLDDVEDFADWLVDKFGFGNNDVVVINPINAISGIPLFDYNTYYAVETLDGNTGGYMSLGFQNMSQSDRFYPGYMAFAIYRNGVLLYKVSAIEVKHYNDGAAIWCYGYNANGEFGRVSAGSFQTGGWTQYNIGRVQGPFQVGMELPSGYRFRNYNYPVFNSESEFIAFMQNATIEVIGDISIVTSEVVLPSQAPDYTDGDGMTIIDGSPNYSVIHFPDSVSVNNLPAIVSTGTVNNPGLETFWGFIPVLAEQTKDAIDLTRGLIYELPQELVVTFYAVMGGLILFGIIKLMREH